ncbi:hypothetical protein [Streptacidiphilus anmyonensis]|uniref:hypothetical protein n=1 Tax=Streptacidiphilus anmyonensis TaxID=405782 RepID=UPI0005A86564|nr:hypothetical protein [Streptacidiphilus anmyonensis]
MSVGEGLGGREGVGVPPPPPPVVVPGPVPEGPGFAEGDALGCADADAEALDDEAEAVGLDGVWWCPPRAVELGASMGVAWSGVVADGPDVEPEPVGVALLAPEPPPATAKPVATITRAPTPPNSIPRRRRAARAR